MIIMGFTFLCWAAGIYYSIMSLTVLLGPIGASSKR